MSTLYRMVVHCDESATAQCAGFVEYSAPDRIRLARAADAHGADSGWLRGFRSGATYDVCPACRPKVEAREKEKTHG